jgi:CHAD domain-containing protein
MRRSRELLEDLRWRGEPPEPVFADFARTIFRPSVDAFFAAANADLSDVKALHQMRIRGKQVRYAMELLAGAFSDSFRQELYPIFGEVQEKLGTINDHVSAITLFSEWIQRGNDTTSQAELAKLIVDENMRLDEERHRFLDWWTAERAASLAERFDDALLVPSQQASRCSDPSQE